jgi:hypothetical protein
MNRRKRNRLLDVGTGALLGFLLGLIGTSAYQSGNLDNLAKMLAVLALMLGAVVAMLWLIHRLWGPAEEE